MTRRSRAVDPLGGQVEAVRNKQELEKVEESAMLALYEIARAENKYAAS